MPEHGCMSALMAPNVSVIEAPRLRLRRLVEDDIPALVEGVGDWDVARCTSSLAHPFGKADARAFLEGAWADRAANTRHVFAIETRIEGRMIGSIEINMDDRPDTFGYWIARDFRAHGYGSEAACAMVRFAFMNAGKSELSAAVFLDNKASARVLEKAGFRKDGMVKDLPGRCAGIEAQVFRIDARDWFAREATKPKLLVSAVALVDVDGRVLVAKRPAGKPLAGLWEFPGGKVRDAETPESALVRELQEELGIDISESCLAPLSFSSHAYEDFHLVMPLYACHTWKGQVAPKEGQTLRWVRPNRLNTLPMPPADLSLLAMVMDVL